MIGLFGGDVSAARQARPGLRDLMIKLGLSELGFGEDDTGLWWGQLVGPGRLRPRSFGRDERQAVRLAGLLDRAVIVLENQGARHGSGKIS